MIYSKAHTHFTAFPLAVIALIVCCFGAGCRPQKQTGPPEKVTIAYTTASNAILTYITFVKGYFTEAGLEATPPPKFSGKGHSILSPFSPADRTDQTAPG